MIEMFVLIVGFGALMYFFMLRPTRQQQLQQAQMQDSLEIGNRVLLGSGVFGTIRHLGQRQIVIEVSPGVDLTVLRNSVRGVVSPDDDEFEYSDNDAALQENVGDSPGFTPYEDASFAAPEETDTAVDDITIDTPSKKNDKKK
ncbi:MAG: preprotein translocase subunit YajC [Propionibacteriaceae bacterium]|nr:preprotein translocase subunit YajC [Propionibacteriaceae bacterium]